jgi:hypothetical protein
VTPVSDLAERVKAVYTSRQPPEESPMLDFDERDLFDLAERAGFEEIHLSYEAKTKPGNLEVDARDWETALRSAPNPFAPTLVPDLGDAEPLARDGQAQGEGVVNLQGAFGRGDGVSMRVVIRMSQQLRQTLGERV